VEYLGSGSFGAVARAHKGGVDYAMKAFVPGREENRFGLEARILSELDHPGIPRFVEALSCEGVDYLVQEFVQGYPLSYYIANGRRFDNHEVRGVLSQLLTILIYLHEPDGQRLPVIHRDLRLSNVFWSNDTVHLIDFGLARHCEETTDRQERQAGHGHPKMERHRPGKATYASLRKEVSHWSDLFGTGVVALDLFTNWIEEEEQFQKPWQDIFPGSDSLKAFITKLVIPEEQFPSARAALDHLEEI
jgi:serine/threonine protein kinase